MAKRHKTRKEKVMSDRRKITPQSSVSESSPTHSSSSLFNLQSSPTPRTAHASTNIHEYDYLSKDLRKTALLTATIVIAEIVLAFILKI